MKAVVLAGGSGTRLRPLTINKPKVMVEVKGEPMLVHILRGLKPHVEEVVLVVGYLKEKVIDYFGNEFEGLKINYVVQSDSKGTGHALLCAEAEIEAPFLLVYGDLYFNPKVYYEVLSQDSAGVIVAKTVPNPESYGVLEVTDGLITDILEKVPNPPSDLINAGIYYLPPEIFEACRQVELSERGEYELTDAVELLINSGLEFKPVVIDEWVDVGTIDRLKRAEEMVF
ncbi:NTP transferase domain-containing protein [archaeon]|nr:NTP transferase domain-containing protein [archaeon]